MTTKNFITYYRITYRHRHTDVCFRTQKEAFAYIDWMNKQNRMCGFTKDDTWGFHLVFKKRKGA